MIPKPDWLLSPERIYALHGDALRQNGGSPGVRQPGCVDGCLGNSLNAALYAGDDVTAEPDVLCVAAHLLFYLSRNHCFADGNKRVAWLACSEQLLLIGLDVDATSAEVENFVVSVADGTVGDASAVQQWIAPRLTSTPNSAKPLR